MHFDSSVKGANSEADLQSSHLSNGDIDVCDLSSSQDCHEHQTVTDALHKLPNTDAANTDATHII